MNNLKEGPIVGKFGGTSMATAETIYQSADIVRREGMRAVVVSAPGRVNGEPKITDLLLQSAELAHRRESFGLLFDQIAARFEGIIDGLGVDPRLKNEISLVRRGVQRRRGREWVSAQGEIIMAKVFAAHLKANFVDAGRIIRGQGEIEDVSFDLTGLSETSESKVRAVIGGFYYRDRRGRIRTFSRGGGDISGAKAAEAFSASVYQNWTDSDGVLEADPRIIEDPDTIPIMTYREMRELAYRGAEILHPDSIVPVALAGISTNVRNTFNPDHPGTMVVKSRERERFDPSVIGIAGQEGFVSIRLYKLGMNNQKGFAARVLNIMDQNGASIDHAPTTIDTMSVILKRSELEKNEEKTLKDLNEKLSPDELEITELGLICLVGQDVSLEIGQILKSVNGALELVEIPMRTVITPDGGHSVIIGVPPGKVSQGIRQIYEAYMR